MLEENEIQALEKLPKQELQKIQEQAADSVQSGLVKLGLVESRNLIPLEEREKADPEEGELVSFILGRD
jgi:hypothetical protein